MDYDDTKGLGPAIDKIADLGRDATDINILTFNPPEGSKGVPKEIDFGWDRQNGRYIDFHEVAEKWRTHPARRTGTASVSTLQSFIDLVNRHKSEHSAIFAATSWPRPSLTAVIDYHEIVNPPHDPDNPDAPPGPVAPNANPAWCGHRVHYAFPVTEEFTAWMQQDGKAMTQKDFAMFVEERIAEIATAGSEEDRLYGELFQTKFANPGDMMMLSRGLEVHVQSQVRAHHTLSSGEREIVFHEEHDTKITVPGLFMVSVPAFLDAVPVRLPARLRYRVSGSGVTWFYQLYRWKELLRAAVLNDLTRAVQDTALPAYEGSAEA